MDIVPICYYLQMCSHMMTYGFHDSLKFRLISRERDNKNNGGTFGGI